MRTNSQGLWLTEWNRSQDAYFGKRHKSAHFAALSDSLRSFLPVGGTVLDFGPGDSLHVPVLTGVCDRVILCEEADVIRAALVRRFADVPKVEVCGAAGLASVPDGSVDLMVAHSVLQYLSPAEVEDLLEGAGRVLVSDGVLLLGDLVQVGLSSIVDVWELVRFAARNGFLLPALAHLARLPFSPYSRARRSAGLATYSVDALAGAAARHDLYGGTLKKNLGNNAARWTFRAVRA